MRACWLKWVGRDWSISADYIWLNYSDVNNGPAYRSREFNTLLEGRSTRHKYTRPLSPWQNGKFVRMNRTLAQERQYARAWESEESRAEALDSFIEHYNWDRPHSACGACPRCHASSA
ncbi:integrase core domain-containing protein [Collinsella sp. AM09-41]|uniref:integrase core domain-containing protein n=1 Tax=Collinsella sp. AM09-41 TaxID=2292017 RepID=UPI000E53B2D6|nr:hypothetical protein DW112_00020 [Collinsella sp. AM09-41]